MYTHSYSWTENRRRQIHPTGAKRTRTPAPISSPSMPPQPPTTINPFGDVTLIATSRSFTASYLASSHQLMATSSFFRNLLSPTSTFSEAVAFRSHNVLGPFPLTVDPSVILSSCDIILLHIHGLPSKIVPGDDDDDYNFGSEAILQPRGGGRLPRLWSSAITSHSGSHTNVGDGQYLQPGTFGSVFICGVRTADRR